MISHCIQSVETVYRSTRFRSRLEARWAAFFDLCEWNWEYEPLDLKGWVPDFVLLGAEPVWVEVKPILDFADDVENLCPALAGTIKRVSSEDGIEALLVGARLDATKDAFGPGLLCQEMGEGFDWCRASFVRGPDFCSRYQAYRSRMSGQYDGSLDCGADTISSIARLWALAGNRTQWRPEGGFRGDAPGMEAA